MFSNGELDSYFGNVVMVFMLLGAAIAVVLIGIVMGIWWLFKHVTVGWS